MFPAFWDNFAKSSHKRCRICYNVYNVKNAGSKEREVRRVFGYVKPYIPELLVREERYYRALYCGLCKTMKTTTGRLSSLSLSYDFVFFVLVRLLTDEQEISIKRHRCIVHPHKKTPMIESNETMRLAARISALLTYHQLRDDLADRGLKKKLRAILLSPVFSRAARRAALPELEGEFRRCLDTMARLEREKSPSVDLSADAFGQMLGAAFAEGLDGANQRICFELGFRLGRFIYAADAAEDYGQDLKKGNYNPYVVAFGGRALTENDRALMHTALRLELTALERAVDLLPFGDHATLRSIIQNVLYLGLPERIKPLGPSDLKGKRDESGSL